MVHTVEIEVSDETLAALRRDPQEYAAELRLAAAAKLFELGRVSQEVAAEIAGLSRADFMRASLRGQPVPGHAGLVAGRADPWLSAGSSTPRLSSVSAASVDST